MTDSQVGKFQEELVELVNKWTKKPMDDRITWAAIVGVMSAVIHEIWSDDDFGKNDPE